MELMRGRPGGRKVVSRCNRLAVWVCHAGVPKGRPRATLVRRASSSLAVSGRLVHCSQSWGGGTGQSVWLSSHGSISVAHGGAAPWPALGHADEIRADRISFDVSADVEEMFVLLDRETFEAPLIERAGSGGFVVGVPALRVSDGEEAHEFAEVAVFLRPEDEVPVIGHQTEADDSNRQAFVRLLDDAQHGGVVAVAVEKPFPTDGPVEDVVSQSSGGNAQASGHERKCTPNKPRKRLPTPLKRGRESFLLADAKPARPRCSTTRDATELALLRSSDSFRRAGGVIDPAFSSAFTSSSSTACKYRIA